MAYDGISKDGTGLWVDANVLKLATTLIPRRALNLFDSFNGFDHVNVLNSSAQQKSRGQ